MTLWYEKNYFGMTEWHQCDSYYILIFPLSRLAVSLSMTVAPTKDHHSVKRKHLPLLMWTTKTDSHDSWENKTVLQSIEWIFHELEKKFARKGFGAIFYLMFRTFFSIINDNSRAQRKHHMNFAGALSMHICRFYFRMFLVPFYSLFFCRRCRKIQL